MNLALNNILRVQNLQRCESLRRLDLTANFIDKAGLLSLHRSVNPVAPASTSCRQSLPLSALSSMMVASPSISP